MKDILTAPMYWANVQSTIATCIRALALSATLSLITLMWFGVWRVIH